MITMQQQVGASVLSVVMSWYGQGVLDEKSVQDIQRVVSVTQQETFERKIVQRAYVPDRGNAETLLGSAPAEKYEPLKEQKTIQTQPYIYPATGLWSQTFSSSHAGIDIANTLGTPIRASADGVVVLSARNDASGYGNWVVLSHANGIETLYAHLHERMVEVGDRVLQGDSIGTMGSTGFSTGPHLHFEIKSGTQKLHPDQFIFRQKQAAKLRNK